MTEAWPHFKAKLRLYNLVRNTSPAPSLIDVEYVYKNPFNRTGNPKWDWKFDVYFEVDTMHELRRAITMIKLPEPRKVALEVDDKKGHSSPKSFKKREHKVAYLKTQGIELFAWPRKWILGRKAYPDQVFLEELGLRPGTKEQIAEHWYEVKYFK